MDYAASQEKIPIVMLLQYFSFIIILFQFSRVKQNMLLLIANVTRYCFVGELNILD